MDDDNALAAAHRALRRFGLGPRPGEARRLATDPRERLVAQLVPGDALLDDAGLSATTDIFAVVKDFKDWERRSRQVATAAPPRPQGTMPADAASVVPAAATAAPAVAEKRDSPIHPIYLAEVQARLDRAATTDNGLVERLTSFWTNHFCVSAQKEDFVKAIVGAYEREAIRPFVLGRFRDMLQAVAHHPAMLYYLDNFRSVGPSTGKRTAGLNENFARELLELHTVGVRSGYTQEDVTFFAKALTGWSVVRQDGIPIGGFQFNRYQHEPGAFTVLGRLYDQKGAAQAAAVLDDLAGHPATARHIAGRLARHFVSESPPASLVDRLAAVFRETDGDLKAVTEALLRSDEAWQAAPAKVLPPWDFLVAARRAVDAPIDARLAVRMLDLFGQPHWSVPSPAGWPEEDMEWAAPDAMLERLDFATSIAGRVAGRVQNVAALAEDVLGPAVAAETMTAVRRAGDRAQAVALLLMSPEFQRR